METLQAGQAGCGAIEFVSVGAGRKVFSDSRLSLSPSQTNTKNHMPERKDIITIAQSTGLRASRVVFDVPAKTAFSLKHQDYSSTCFGLNKLVH